MNSPMEHVHAKKKRVGKACDSCRIKKTKCDGKKPCNRCTIDNKICVFTEKKKHKEKNHSQGYVELLETRLDILTKALDKLVQLSAPHVPFLQQMLAEHKEPENYTESDSNEDDEGDSPRSESAISINRVVSYLINEQGLLANLPVEWERGALIAANFSPNNVEQSSKLFAEHNAAVDEKEQLSPAPFSQFSNRSFSSEELPFPQSPVLEGFPKRANSLFLNSRQNSFDSVNSQKRDSSVTSLTIKLEQGSLSPVPSSPTTIHLNGNASHHVRKMSGSFPRPSSPKPKDGHIKKPQRKTHPSSSSLTSAVVSFDQPFEPQALPPSYEQAPPYEPSYFSRNDSFSSLHQDDRLDIMSSFSPVVADQMLHFESPVKEISGEFLGYEEELEFGQFMK